MATLKLGVLGSGAGSNMQSIMDAIAAGTLDAEVRLVLADVADAKILDRARHHSIPCRFLDGGAVEPTGCRPVIRLCKRRRSWYNI